MSLSEDQKSGPTDRPSAGIATVQFTWEYVMANWVWISGNEGTVVVVR